jgi:hypothetical protein
MDPSTFSFFYSSATRQAYSSGQMLQLFAIDTQIFSIEVLNYQSFYPVVETPITADTGLYTASPEYTVVGEIADQTWVYTARPLEEAKSNGTIQVQNAGNLQVSEIVGNSGYSAEVLSAAGAELEGARPAVYQTVIAAEQVVTDQLALDVAAIAAATTVDQINDIVNPPIGTTGIISIGRGGQPEGDLMLNASYYVSFSSSTLTEAETELYVPYSSTVVPYALPGGFAATGNVFDFGDYRTQIRVAATSEIIAEFDCPYAPSNEDVPF